MVYSSVTGGKMFPNNFEFFLREKEVERKTDIEQIRLIKQLNRRSPWPPLGRLLCWLGRQLIGLGEKIQGQSGRIHPTAIEQSTL